MTTGETVADPVEAADVRDTAVLLMAVTEWTRHSFDATAARFDLTPAQARALLALESAVPMRSLAHQLHCDASNITGIADRLEAGGLVTRVVSPDDRRIKLLELTPEGARTRARLGAAVVSASPITTGLSADERAALRALLAKVVDVMSGRDACGPQR